MNKKKDFKRKQQLASRFQFESLSFQVEFSRKEKRFGDNYNELINQELKIIQKMNLASDLLDLNSILKELKATRMISNYTKMNSFNGSYVAYLLGITDIHPNLTNLTSPFIESCDETKRYFQAKIYFDNAIRNQVIDWLKSKQYTLSTRLGQPILKLSKIVVEIARYLNE